MLDAMIALTKHTSRQAHSHPQKSKCRREKRLTEAGTDMEIKDWERRNSEFALYESRRELESQRFPLRQASQWADQSERGKIRLCGELEMKSRLYQENYTRSRREIEELRRKCCEETDWARKNRTDELFLQQERNPDTVSRLMSHDANSGFTGQSEFLVRCHRISRSWNTEQLWSVPRSQSTLHCFESQKNAEPRFWMAARYAEQYGKIRKHFWKPTCSKRTILKRLR